MPPAGSVPVHAAVREVKSPANPATVAAPQPDEVCRDCMTPRHAGARFCEVCRYDFVAKASFSGLAGEPPVPAPAPAPVVAEPVNLAPDVPAVVTQAVPVSAAPVTGAGVTQSGSSALGTVAMAAPTRRLLLRIVVDARLYKDPDPEEPCPINEPERIFHLDLEENTLGRQYEGKGVHPEIVVQDPGISRRHLKFMRDVGGGFSVLELGSANGTYFNDKELQPGVMTPIGAGDQLTLGMWTRIHIQAR